MSSDKEKPISPDTFKGKKFSEVAPHGACPGCGGLGFEEKRSKAAPSTSRTARTLDFQTEDQVCDMWLDLQRANQSARAGLAPSGLSIALR